MPQLCLQQQVQRLTSQLNIRIHELLPHDPAKDWFLFELDSLTGADRATSLSLDEWNCRLRGLQQLQHLVCKHHEKVGTAEEATATQPQQDSYLTAEARLPAATCNAARRLRFSIQPSLLHEVRRTNIAFDPVSPTAKVVAYLRGLDKSLQFDGDQSLRQEGAAVLSQLGITDIETHVAMAVLFQSRYHALNAAIGMSGATASQIIELASGLSPRGYQWSQMSPGTIYVESDLPQLMICKAKTVRNAIIANTTENRGLLHHCAADVLDLESMLEALNSIDTRMPFTVLTEGLLLYFTNSELQLFLENMVALLSRGRQAIWLTDLVTQANLTELFNSHSGVARSVRKVFELTGRTVIAHNPLQTDACVGRYLQDFGLRVDRTVPLQLVAAQLNLSIPIESALRKKIVGSRKIWSISICE